jgi:signal-transduction protein with cAMP-binding, CBS, and nucleotidyltransferase domain
MTDTTAVARIDPFPFQHRVADLMKSDVPIMERSASLAAATDIMARRNASAIIVLDAAGRPAGIVTERDILLRLAADAGEALEVPLSEVMSAPVASVPADAFVYLAIARMDRLRHRHLAVVHPESGAFVGLLDARAVLHQRATVALAVADQVAQAGTAQELAAAFGQMPELGRSLRAEGVAAHQVAAVISGVIRDMTARAGQLAATAMEANGKGHAPADWCLLVLGSGGRGESLLAADQDNALIHGFLDDDHPWFEEFSALVAQILDAAGIPYCRGGVMAKNRNLRHNLAGWQQNLGTWFDDPEPRAILNADIFYDFAPVEGQFALADELRRAAARAEDAKLFLNLMANEIGEKSGALGWFGRFKTKKGRVDLKMGGLFPIVAGGRVLALRLGSTSLSSRDRWRDAFSAGIIVEEDLARLLDAHELILGLILDQQIEDLGKALPATSQVEVRRLLDLEQDRLKEALHVVGQIDLMVKNALQDAVSLPREAGRHPDPKATPGPRTRTLPE